MTGGGEWTPDSELAEAVDAIVKFEGVPNEPETPEEKDLWQKFKAWFVPKAREKGIKAAELLEERGELEVAEKREEVRQTAAETAEIVARVDQRRAQTVKIVGEEIRAIFSDPDMPDEARMLQLANLLDNNPGIAEQLEKVIEVYSRLSVVHGVRVGVEEPEEVKNLAAPTETRRITLYAPVTVKQLAHVLGFPPAVLMKRFEHLSIGEVDDASMTSRRAVEIAAEYGIALTILPSNQAVELDPADIHPMVPGMPDGFKPVFMPQPPMTALGLAAYLEEPVGSVLARTGKAGVLGAMPDTVLSEQQVVELAKMVNAYPVFMAIDGGE